MLEYLQVDLEWASWFCTLRNPALALIVSLFLIHPEDMGSPKLEDDNIAFCVLMSETVTELRTLLCTTITHHEGYHSVVLVVNNLLQLSQLPPVSDSLATNPSLHLFGGPLQTCRSGNGHSEVVNR